MTTRCSLTQSQAARCEHAATSRCRCRCGGRLHGAGRVTTDELERLPPGDPHKANPPRGRPGQTALEIP